MGTSQHALLIAALVLGGTLAAGCATTTKVLGADGATCAMDADCAQDLACKASKCTPARSRVGQVCVTDLGCEEELSCLKGRCSVGLASEAEVQAACAQMRSLIEAMAKASPEEMSQPGAQEEFAKGMEAFATECPAQMLSGGASFEFVSCAQKALSIEAFKDCR